MIHLIPAENWEYSLRDMVSGILFLLGQNYHHEMIHIDGVGDCIPVRSGRAAIVTAIQALQLKPGSCIGVPLYSCPVVFKAIKETGCIPIFIDIEPDTFNISPDDLSKKSSILDAVIVIHMFGNVCDMSSITNAAKSVPIIEDCAQSLGSMFHKDMTGTQGTVGVFSFRSGKYLSVGEGGALFTQNKQTHENLTNLISKMEPSKRIDESIHISKTYIRSKLRSKPLFGIIGKKIWQIYNQKIDYKDKTPIVIGQIYKSDLRLTLNRLTGLHNAVMRNRSYADYYLKNLNFDSEMLCYEKPGTFYNRYSFPIVFYSPSQRDAMGEYLQSKRIDTIKPYKDIAEIASKYYGYVGDCPVTEQIARRILLIPNHHRLIKKDIRRISKCLNENWAIIKNQDDRAIL